MLSKIIGFIVAVPVAIAAFIALSWVVAWPVQYLHNYLWASVFGVMSFKQAWALTLLCNLLFKGK